MRLLLYSFQYLQGSAMSINFADWSFMQAVDICLQSPKGGGPNTKTTTSKLSKLSWKVKSSIHNYERACLDAAASRRGIDGVTKKNKATQQFARPPPTTACQNP